MAAPDFEIPDGTSVTFDPTKDFVTQLPDGTELTIPGGAANVDSTVTEVRIVITPTAKGLSKSADEKPAIMVTPLNSSITRVRKWKVTSKKMLFFQYQSM